ncbi:hypothetical protein D1007_27209 [Hordeum vulgare]|nr:hypothetical protein D1007_27209 [Hordeum vulgare]
MDIGSSSDDYQLTDDESTGGFDVYPTHHMDEDEDSESEEDRCGKRKGSQNPINSRSSIKKMKGLVDRLCEQKRCLVREMGFEGLLHLPVVTRSNRKQSMWLMSKDRREGIRYGINIGLHKITPIMRIVELKYRIPMTKDESRQFKVAFAICAMTFLLALPLKHNYFTTDYWNALHMPDLIQMFNWDRYIREELLSSAGRVFYLDNLDREEKNLAHNVFPRCKEYNQKTIAEIIDEDTSTGKDAEIVVYGHLLVICWHYHQQVEQFSNKCQTVVQEASRKGARLNRKHAMGWEEIVQNTNDVIVEESSRIISDINQITDAMREIKKTTNYTTNSDGIQEDKEETTS